MKNKINIQKVLIIMIFLLFVTGCKNKKNITNENIPPENETAIQENSSEESEITILESEGEVEIEIPEDMESDGF